MNARAFLVRGLLAGLLAGLATFFVAHQVGEPHVDAAIAVEEAHAVHEEAAEPAGHHHEEDGTVVTRENQSTWGLLTGTLSVGIVLGGLVALISAAVAGRIGRLDLVRTTLLVCVVGFLAYSFVPFLKYPATPPAVGNPDTIGSRTNEYFGFMAISVVLAIAAVVLAVRLAPKIGTYGAVVAGLVGYLALVIITGELFPTVNEIGDFPADTLWYFRRASLLTLATQWSVIGVVLTGLLIKLRGEHNAVQARRELAAAI